MEILKDISILIVSLPALVGILGGILKVLRRRLELRESKVRERERRAAALAYEVAQAECMVWAFCFAAAFILYFLVKSSSQMQA
jgi:Na+/proline symporter